MEPAARDAKLDAVTELVKLAIKSAEGGKWDIASQHLDEATSAFQSIPADDNKKHARYLSVGASIAEGKGQLALRAGQVEEGAFHLEEALKLRRDESDAGGTPPPLSIGITLVNLTGACHRLGRLEDALRFNQSAIVHLETSELPPARVFLAAAIEARGNLLSQMDRHEEALVELTKSGALAADLAARGFQGAPQLLTEVFVAHARAAAKAGNLSEAMRLASSAADVAWERFERNPQGDREAIGHWVAGQMNLVNFAEQAGRYAEGEDALFKVLRIAGPDPRVVQRGKAFYAALLKLDDARLEAGNLPRDEVEESLQKLEEIGKPRPTASA